MILKCSTFLRYGMFLCMVGFLCMTGITHALEVRIAGQEQSIAVQAGAQTEGVITFENDGLLIYTYEITPVYVGGVVGNPDHTGLYERPHVQDPAPWLSLPHELMVLTPRTRAALPYVLEVPATALPGVYWYRIDFVGVWEEGFLAPPVSALVRVEVERADEVRVEWQDITFNGAPITEEDVLPVSSYKGGILIGGAMVNTGTLPVHGAPRWQLYEQVDGETLLLEEFSLGPISLLMPNESWDLSSAHYFTALEEKENHEYVVRFVFEESELGPMELRLRGVWQEIQAYPVMDSLLLVYGSLRDMGTYFSENFPELFQSSKL